MNVITNVTRAYIGGITRSNISFLNFTQKQEVAVSGIELVPTRQIKGATIFNHLSLDCFSHSIINIHDIPIRKAIISSKNLKDLEKKYRSVIETIKKIMLESDPDVVLLNGTYYIPWLISIAAHELKIPIVLRYAGVYSKETEGTKPKERRFYNEMEKSFQKRVDHFIFPSRLCQNLVEKEIIQKKVKKAYVISNPFNIPKDEAVFESVERRIAAVGRWDKIKNFEKFFEIHKSLNKEGWKHEASFVTNNGKIKAIPKTINRFSSMTHDELLKFYSSQGLIICPSIFETFGNVPVEAVCMGVPVLVSENMGCAEVLKIAGLESMVVDFNNNKEVIKRVKKLCGQQILPKQVNNLRKILDPQVINTEIMSVLREAIGVNNI